MGDSFEGAKDEFIGLLRRARRVTAPVPETVSGVTPTGARVLHVLLKRRARGAAVRPGPLAANLRTTPSALSQILKELEGAGLIVRTRDARDSRGVMLDLTPAGERIAREVDEAFTEFVRKLFEEIGPDDMGACLATFSRIVDVCEGYAALAAERCGAREAETPDPRDASAGDGA